jgi:ATP phosphoribosyltransferase
VAAGTLDVGITGRDMLLETAPGAGEGHAAVEVMPLGFGRSSFRFASPVESGLEEVDQLGGKRIATAYPVLLQNFLEDSGIKAEVVKLDGAVETACRLGVADAVCDVVETGTTLRAAGLHIIGEPVLTSEAILVRRAGAEEIPAVAQLRRRLQGVMVARQYVLLDYDCPNELLERATAVTPGLEGPTVSPLQTPGWSAVRAMVRQTDTNRVMDELWELGARAILVTSIHASRI